MPSIRSTSLVAFVLIGLTVFCADVVGQDTPTGVMPEALEVHRAALARGDIDAAVTGFRSAFEGASEGDLLKGQAALGLGAALTSRGDFEQASEVLDGARAIFGARANDAWLGVTWYHLGVMESARNQTVRAIEAFSMAEQSFTRARTIDGSESTAQRWRASSLVRLGNAVRPDDAMQAAKYYGDAAEIFERAGDALLEADARYREGLAHWSLRDYEEAAIALETSLRLYREGDDPKWVAISQSSIGQVRLAQRQFDDAQRRFKLALEEMTRISGAEPYELSARLGLGDALLGLNTYEEAAAAYLEAGELARKLDNDDFRAAAMLGQAHSLELRGNLDDADRGYRDVLTFLEGRGGARYRVEAWMGLGNLAAVKGLHGDALAAFDEANTLNAVVGDPALGLVIDLGRGAAMLEAGQYADADELLAAADELLPAGASLERGQLLAGRGAIAHAQGNFAAAHEYFDGAAELFDDLGNRLELGRIHVANAETYAADNDPRRAERSISAGVSSLREAGAKRELAEALFILAGYQASRDKTRDALENFLETATLQNELGDFSGAGRTQLAMARLHLADGDKKDALEAARAAVTHLDQDGGVPGPDRPAAHLIVAEILVANDKFDDARVHAELAATLSGPLGMESEGARASLLLGLVLLNDGKPDEARPHLDTAQSALLKLGDTDGAAEALFGLGRIQVDKGEATAVETLEQAKLMFKDAGNSRRAGVVRELLRTLE